jgi:hypothetical protein
LGGRASAQGQSFERKGQGWKRGRAQGKKSLYRPFLSLYSQCLTVFLACATVACPAAPQQPTAWPTAAAQSVSHLMYIFAQSTRSGKIVCSRAQVEQSHLHSAGSAFIAWSAVISVARLSGHTGLKLSIRRLAFYTRQPARCLPYRRCYRGGGELSSSSLSNYLSIATTSIHLPPPTAGVFTRPSVRAAIARATRPSQT